MSRFNTKTVEAKRKPSKAEDLFVAYTFIRCAHKDCESRGKTGFYIADIVNMFKYHQDSIQLRLSLSKDCKHAKVDKPDRCQGSVRKHILDKAFTPDGEYLDPSPQETYRANNSGIAGESRSGVVTKGIAFNLKHEMKKQVMA